MRTIFAGCVMAIGGMLHGCCPGSMTKDEAWEERRKRFAEEGVDIIGAAERFAVYVKEMECLNTDDGLFGGNTDELRVTISCSGPQGEGGSATMADSFEDGTLKYEQCHDDAINTFMGENLRISCPPESSVILRLEEGDDFSADDVGTTEISWENIATLPNWSRISFGTEVQSVSLWDQLWDQIQFNVQVCLTDLVPSTRTARALMFSARSIRHIKNVNSGIKQYSRLQRHVERCDENGVEPCGDVAAALDDVWNLQCTSATSGSYRFVLEFAQDGALRQSSPWLLLFFIFSTSW